MQNTATMSLNELMRYHLSGSRKATGTAPPSIAGAKVSVYAETVGGEGYRVFVEATAWGKLSGGSIVLLGFPGKKYYALSPETFREVYNLVKRDLSDCEVIEGRAATGGKAGTEISVILKNPPKNKNHVRATLWCDAPPGDLKLFQVDRKLYAISLTAFKLIRETVVREARRGVPADSKREIIWSDINWH